MIDSLAWVYFRRGELEPAWEHIQRAVDLAGQKGTIDPAMLEHMGDIANARGDTVQAQTNWRRALELFLKYDFKDEAARVRAKLEKMPQ